MWREILESGSGTRREHENGFDAARVSGKKLWLGNCAVNASLTGKSFAEIGRLRGAHPFDAVCDILIEENGAVSFYGEDKADPDIDCLARGGRIAAWDRMGSQWPIRVRLRTKGSIPAATGAMAYLIRTLVRERGVLSLEASGGKAHAVSGRSDGI